jgi:hypothetical protein
MIDLNFFFNNRITGRRSSWSICLTSFKQRGHLTLEFLKKFRRHEWQIVWPQWIKILGNRSFKLKSFLQSRHCFKLSSLPTNSPILSKYSMGGLFACSKKYWVGFWTVFIEILMIFLKSLRFLLTTEQFAL